jgi:poly-gamma-glutamate synthesis protein (capsule biosynthesis protein)
VAFLAYVDAPAEGSFRRETWEAGPGQPGVAWLDLEEMTADIRAAREAADAVVVLLHFGREFYPEPTETQRAQARAAVDAGAALVLGSHPHVLQEVERYGAGLIAFSLGNFVFDGFDPPSNTSAILRVELSAAGAGEYELLPVEIDWQGLPHLAE